jgi:hypothetical protein
MPPVHIEPDGLPTTFTDDSVRTSPVTRRSITLGLLGTVVICGLTPYNDYALNNTFLVGNNLPLGVVVLVFLFTLVINGPLARFAPRFALSSGEAAVAFAMMLVSCALPSSGLMRYLPAVLTGPVYFSRDDAQFRELFEAMGLPRWLFPTFSGDSLRQWMSDPVVEGFHLRWNEPGRPPYSAWITPVITWGVFVFALYGALLCMVTIVRRQWFENERLPFPLAQIQLALVEQPAHGKWFNSVLSCRSFWIAFAAVFLLHVYNGMSGYFPRHVVRIPIGYNIHEILSEQPWAWLDSKIKDNTIFFTALGVAYFLPGSISFSLWFFYILSNVHRLSLGAVYNDPENYGRFDEHFGGTIAYAIMIGWIGRHHFCVVFAQAFRGERADEPRDTYLPYPLAFWGFVACAAIMTGWLFLAGCTLPGAFVTVVTILLLFLMITRIIGETGFIHGQLQTSMVKAWTLARAAGWVHPVPITTYYFGRLMQGIFYDFREVVPVYASHGMKVTDQLAMSSDGHDEAAFRRRRSTGMKLIGLLVLSLLVGYVVSFGSMLWTEYTFDATRDAIAESPINKWGARDNVIQQVMQPTVYYARGEFYPQHSIAGHIIAGFGITGLLAFLRLRYTWWPLHPVGYLMVPTFGAAHLWFSIMLGWMLRGLILRFGGSKLYTDAKPFFIGLIVAESMAAGFWLAVSIVLSAMGIPYRAVNVMPG